MFRCQDGSYVSLADLMDMEQDCRGGDDESERAKQFLCERGHQDQCASQAHSGSQQVQPSSGGPAPIIPAPAQSGGGGGGESYSEVNGGEIAGYTTLGI